MEQTESDNQQRNIIAKGMVQTENGFLCDEIKAGVLAKGKRCIKLYLSNSVMKNTEGKNKKMTKAELMKALKNLKVQTGSLACLGCGHEHNCSTRGCTIIRAAVEELKKTQWVSAADRPPEEVKEQAEMKVVQEMEQRHPRLKLRIGSSVYFVIYDSGLIGEHGEWKVSEEKVVEIGLNGFFISQIKNSSEPNEYIPYTDVGEYWFFSQEEAEKARKAKEQEKICCNCRFWTELHFDGQCDCSQSEFYLQYIPADRHCECFKEEEN